jgi:hypothetical protein
VVDNLPKVGPEKFEKLTQILTKIFSSVGKIREGARRGACGALGSFWGGLGFLGVWGTGRAGQWQDLFMCVQQSVGKARPGWAVGEGAGRLWGVFRGQALPRGFASRAVGEVVWLRGVYHGM